MKILRLKERFNSLCDPTEIRLDDICIGKRKRQVIIVGSRNNMGDTCQSFFMTKSQAIKIRDWLTKKIKEMK